MFSREWMTTSAKNLAKRCVFAIALCVFAENSIASVLSVSESPSTDGDFRVLIQSEIWSSTRYQEGTPVGDLREYYTPIAGGEMQYSDQHTITAGYPYQEITDRPSGFYKYEFKICYDVQYQGYKCGEPYTVEVEVLDSLRENINERVELSDYDMYYGDINNDGIDGDIFFHGRDKIIIIAGDVNIPITIDGPQSFALYRQQLNNYQYPQLIDLDDQTIAALSKAALNTDFFEGDINGDGQLDYFLRGQYSLYPALSIIQSDIGFPIFSIPVIDEFSRFDPSDRRNTIALQDYNLDGRDDLVMLSGPGGYVIDVIYADVDGRLDESYYVVTDINEILNINTHPVNAVGTLGGSFRVSESGAATYNVPILTPEGTAGVTPSVSLSYSSQGGAGIAGLGWSLNAYASISRCRQTYEQDKKTYPLNWSSTDRFCLNGQRLLLASGQYGQSGATYTTATSPQDVVTQHGVINGEPDYFTVIKKDGSITYFGHTTDNDSGSNSKQSFAAGKTLAWHQSRTEDNAGNPIRFFYAHDSGSNFRLVRIDYAYGGGSVAHSSIKFDYEQRPDVMDGYMAGMRSTQRWRLKKIDVDNTVSTSTNIRTYHIFYSRDLNDWTSKKRSLVVGMQECVRSSCSKPTKFDWDIAAGHLSDQAAHEIEIGSSDEPIRDYKQADINGDGVLDIVWLAAYAASGGSVDVRFRYALSTNGVLTPARFEGGANYLTFYENVDQTIKLEVLDYNADGRHDVAVYRSRGDNPDRWSIYLAVPTMDGGDTNWHLSATPVSTNVPGKHAIFADIDGDGLVDALSDSEVYHLKHTYLYPEEAHYSSNKFYSFRTATPNLWLDVNSSFPYQSGAEAYHRYLGTGDFNGDGKLDFIGGDVQEYIDDKSFGWYTRDLKEHLYVLVQAEGGLQKILYLGYREKTTQNEMSDFEDKIPLVGDANGDGLSDVFLHEGNNVYWYASTGNGFAPRKLVNAVSPESRLQLTDFNFDGHVDLVSFDHTRINEIHISLWDDSRKEFSGIIQYQSDSNENSSHIFTDANGDGLTDYVRFSDRTLSTFHYQSDTGTNDLVVAIGSGLGASTQINYEPINTSSSYVGLDIEPQPEGEVEHCDFKILGAEGNCVDYTLYSADDFYYALNKGLNAYADIKLTPLAPVLEFNGPFYVVTSVTSTVPSSTLSSNPLNPTGNIGAGSVSANTSATVSYAYGEAKVQAGRGFLGFHRLTSKDEQTGIETTTIYRQDFPFMGSPVSTYVQMPGSGLLSESHNVYSAKGWPADANEIVASQGTTSLGSFIPYVQDSYEIIYETSSSAGDGFDLVSANAFNLTPSCVSGAAECPTFSDASSKQQVARQIITSTQIDNFGNTLSSTTETHASGLMQKLVSEHEYGPGKSLILHGKTISYAQLGRLTSTTVRRSRNGIIEPAKTSAFAYYEQNSEGGYVGMLKTDAISPDGSDAEKVTTTYTYDTLGNLLEKTISGWDGQAKVSRGPRMEYDATGRYLTASYDAMGHRHSQVMARNEYGAATVANGINGNITTKRYDVWGREIYSGDSTGNWQSTEYRYCPTSVISCPSSAKMVILQKDAGSDSAVRSASFLDLAGREIRTATLAFDGGYIYKDKEYDVQGRVVRVSNPYFASEGTPQYWTRTYYDLVGQPIVLLEPNGAISHMQYSGYATTTINAKGQRKTDIKNAFGELVEVIDDDNGRITYTYTTDGLLRSTTAHKDSIAPYAYGTISGLCQQPTSNLQTILCYDALGRKTQMWDPDKGHWHYEYNAFGELIRQTNANGHVVETQYDLLGRQVSRTDYKNGSILEGKTSWYYDTEDDLGQPVANALLQQTAVVYTKGAATAFGDGTNYAERTLFDSIGRPVSSLVQMPDGEVYSTRTEYDATGRVVKEYNALTDKIIRNGEAIESGIQNHYTTFGFLDRVTNLEDGAELYKPQEFDARGQLKQALLGGLINVGKAYHEASGNIEVTSAGIGSMNRQYIHYDWDQLGNLQWRHNYSGASESDTGRLESFCYDNINRLIKTVKGTKAPVCPTSPSAFDVEYDQLGNITRKHDVGSYQYALTSNGQRVGPHALTATTTAAGAIINRYYYDANGNVVSDGERSFTYSTFDKPTLITKGVYEIRFDYGPGRSRFYREDTSSSGIQKTWYLGNIEKIEKPGGSVEWRRQVAGGALHTYHTDANGVETDTVTKRYILKDHLGSTDVILNAIGAVDQLMSFDPWGERRNATTWTDFTMTQLLNFDHSITTRGYTGHEMLDEAGIIHMNGRIYDPRLGRFLQADPFVQSPTDTQSLNRYSYVRNNPLNATDPSGYFFETIFLSIWISATTTSIAQAAHMPGLAMVGSLFACVGSGGWHAVACAGGAGFGSTIAATGDFEKALGAGLLGAASAWAFKAIGDHFFDESIKNANTEGVPKFGGLKLKPHQVAMQIGAHALVGGILSDIQGGKFAHGFVSAGLTKAVMGFANFDYQNKDPGAIALRTAVAAVVGGTTSQISGGKFANGAYTAAMAHLFNQEGLAEKERVVNRTRIGASFRVDNEAEIMKNLEKHGWNGKDDIVFFGYRPLKGDAPVIHFGGSKNVYHEHMFGVVDGALVNIGYTGDVLGVAQDPMISDGDYSLYRFGGHIYVANFEQVVSRVMSSSSWSASNYDLLTNNCQDFASAARKEMGY